MITYDAYLAGTGPCNVRGLTSGVRPGAIGAMSRTVDAVSAREYLARTDRELSLYIDAAHLTHLDVYLGRAHARWAIGDDPAAVVADLRGASACYAANGDVYLAKWPKHRFRARRLTGLELAIAVGTPARRKAIAQHIGLDAMSVVAGMEPPDVTAEVEMLTGWFREREAAGTADVTGALAVLYWGALTGLAAGDPPVTMASIVTAEDVVASAPEAAVQAGLRLEHAALRPLVDPAALPAAVEALLTHVGQHEEARLKRAASDIDIHRIGADALDLRALALWVALRNAGLSLPADGPFDRLLGAL